MVGFSYIYKSQEDIFNDTVRISEMWIWDIFAVTIAVWSTLFITLVLLPCILIVLRHRKEKKEKQNKRKLLTQILLQKEIEDEVENEVQIEDEAQINQEKDKE